MKKSIFRKISLIILLVVLIVDAALLAVSYKLSYDRSYDSCEKRLQMASGMTEELLAYFCSRESLTDVIVSDSLEQYCTTMGLPYIYAFTVDKAGSAIEYLAIGFGQDATEEGRRELYPGARIELELPEELLEVYEGRAETSTQHVKNKYGETLICYALLRQRYDAASDTFVPYTGEPIVIGVDISLTSVMEELGRVYGPISILLVVMSVSIVIAFAFVLLKKVSKPVRRISNRMSNFVEDYDEGFQPLPVKGEDEFSEMSRSFNTMAENIHSYLDNIKVLNREKATRQAELDIAGDIQLGLLGKSKYETDSFRIDARMIPAKDVGGDLYDYLLLDDGKIFLTVADVSGKGISASLFMSRAVTLLHLYANMNHSPAEILKEYNDMLSEYNPGGLFITTFVAIYDPVTRELTYSNGGHNIPYVLSDRLIMLDQAKGIAAGVFPGEDFREAKIRLKEGDVIFLYTDGVNEAVSKDRQLYSVERLEDTLKRCMEAGEESPLNVVQQELRDFTEDTQQSDDITMLTLKILTGDMVLHLKADESELHRVKEAVLSLPVSEDMHRKLYLAAEEMFINICSYAYDKTGDVQVRIAMKDEAVEITFTDGGRPFDPSKDVVTLEEYDYDNAVGGLGRFLTFTLADDHRYEYKDKKNILWLRFGLEQKDE